MCRNAYIAPVYASVCIRDPTHSGSEQVFSPILVVCKDGVSGIHTRIFYLSTSCMSKSGMSKSLTV